MSLMIQVILGLVLGLILINLLPLLIAGALGLVGISVAALSVAGIVVGGASLCLIPLALVYQSYDSFGLIGAVLVILIGYAAGAWLNKKDSPQKLTLSSSVRNVLMGWFLIYAAIFGGGFWAFFQMIPIVIGFALGDYIYSECLHGDPQGVWLARLLGAGAGLLLIALGWTHKDGAAKHEEAPQE